MYYEIERSLRISEKLAEQGIDITKMINKKHYKHFHKLVNSINDVTNEMTKEGKQMKYTLDTVNKTIQIESATAEEVVKLCKQYNGYKVISAYNYPYVTYPQVWTEPYIAPSWTEPYNPNWIVTSGTYTPVDCGNTLTNINSNNPDTTTC